MKNPQHTPRPRWAPPYNDPPIVAGFKIIGYLGFISAGDEKRKYHSYRVVCTHCKAQAIRRQAGLLRAEKQGRSGCAECSSPFYKRPIAEQQTEEAHQWRQMCEEWKEFLFTMPVTSLRWRDEQGKAFDSEKVKVLGWHTT